MKKKYIGFCYSWFVHRDEGVVVVVVVVVGCYRAINLSHHSMRLHAAVFAVVVHEACCDPAGDEPR